LSAFCCKLNHSFLLWEYRLFSIFYYIYTMYITCTMLAIMALIGFSSYCTLKVLFSWVTVPPPRVTVLEPSFCPNLQSA
jgi:hypothetical protein